MTDVQGDKPTSYSISVDCKLIVLREQIYPYEIIELNRFVINKQVEVIVATERGGFNILSADKQINSINLGRDMNFPLYNTITCIDLQI